MKNIKSVNVRATITGEPGFLKNLDLGRWTCYDFSENSLESTLRADLLIDTDGVPPEQAVAYQPRLTSRPKGRGFTAWLIILTT